METKHLEREKQIEIRPATDAPKDTKVLLPPKKNNINVDDVSFGHEHYVSMNFIIFI